MKKISVALSLILSIALLSGCGAVSADSTELSKEIVENYVEPVAANDDFRLSQYRFATELFKGCYSQDENTLVSPLSVMEALAMTANGADTETLSEMEQVLSGNMGLDSLNEHLYSYKNSLKNGEKNKLSIANSIWFRDAEGFSVKKDFLQKNADYYGAAVYKAAFDNSTVQEINGWVKEKTEGMIKAVIKEIKKETMLYLINAVCFKAEWEEIYNEFSVKQDSFTDIHGEIKTVDMMYSGESVYLEDENSTGFIKYYKDRNYAFAAILPDADISFNKFVASLSAEGLKGLLEGQKTAHVSATMPKFTTEFSLELNETLKAMGINRAFSTEADLSKMSDLPLYVSSVIHKTFIKVDEKGTEAGAATVVANDAGGVLMDFKEVTLDRPFIYMIIDCKENLPIFMGSLTEIE